MRLLLKSLLAVLLIAFLSTCESEPTEIGGNLLPEEDNVGLTSMRSDTLDWYQYSYAFTYDSLKLGSSTRLLLGNFKSNSADNNYEIASHFLVRWYIGLSDTIIDRIKNDELTVKKSWMTLKPVYNTDAYENIDFEIHRINESWDPSEFYIENFKNLDFDKTDNLFERFMTMEVDSIEGKTDSVIAFCISNALTDSWLQVRADTSLSEKNYGVLFSPKSSMNATMGFVSANASIADYNPTLYIAYEYMDSTGYTHLDTMKSTTVIFDTHVNEVTSSEIELNRSDKFILHAGVPTTANFFIDISDVPSNALINYAELSFAVDTTNSQYAGYKSDTLYVLAYSDSTHEDREYYNAVGILHRKDGFYTGSITSIVQYWVRQVDNLGLAVSLGDEERSISRVEIYNSHNTDPAHKPKLNIVYTTIPGQ